VDCDYRCGDNEQTPLVKEDKGKPAPARNRRGPFIVCHRLDGLSPRGRRVRSKHKAEYSLPRVAIKAAPSAAWSLGFDPPQHGTRISAPLHRSRLTKSQASVPPKHSSRKRGPAQVAFFCIAGVILCGRRRVPIPATCRGRCVLGTARIAATSRADGSRFDPPSVPVRPLAGQAFFAPTMGLRPGRCASCTWP
jgi:hypothetical protein